MYKLLYNSVDAPKFVEAVCERWHWFPISELLNIRLSDVDSGQLLAEAFLAVTTVRILKLFQRIFKSCKFITEF
jgi:hypothetical protein